MQTILRVDLVRFYIRDDMQQVISEISHSRQSNALVLTTRKKITDASETLKTCRSQDKSKTTTSWFSCLLHLARNGAERASSYNYGEQDSGRFRGEPSWLHPPPPLGDGPTPSWYKMV